MTTLGSDKPDRAIVLACIKTQKGAIISEGDIKTLQCKGVSLWDFLMEHRGEDLRVLDVPLNQVKIKLGGRLD